jgi:hypothetical protein
MKMGGEEHPDAVLPAPDMDPQISALSLHEKQAKNRAKGPDGAETNSVLSK